MADENVNYRRFLYGVQLALLLICVLTFLGLVFGASYSLSRAVFFPIFVTIIGLSYFQLRRSVRRGAVVLIVGIWIATSALTVSFAGVHSANLLIYALLLVLTGWIMGDRWLIGITGATIVLMLGLSAAELLGFYNPSPRASVLVVGSTVMGTLIAISVLTSVAYRSLAAGRDHALALAQEMAQKARTLAQRERDLEMIMENVPAALASFDAQSRLRFGNKRYGELFGAKPEDLVGRNIADYVPEEARAALMEKWDSCLAGEAGSYRRINRDPQTGQKRIVDVEVVPEYDHGQVTGLFALVLDVTEKVAAENRIRELNDTLEMRVRERTAELEAALDKLHRSQDELARSETKAALSTLIASVSHELSTPLGNSLMMAGTLSDQGTVFEKAIEANQLKRSDLTNFVKTVHEGNDLMQRNLQRAVDLLKNFRQVANDHASEQRRSFDLAIMVGEIVDTLAPSLKRHPHKVVIDIPSGITMDSLPGALGQVAINLINNAYIHAFEGRNDGVLTISAHVVDDEVWLNFSDNGVGISPENLTRMFEPFFSTKKGKGGSGLGMGIVENLVQKTLGGSIRVQSELGLGTVFEVHLPLVAPEQQAR